jgi:hypothetical protein
MASNVKGEVKKVGDRDILFLEIDVSDKAKAAAVDSKSGKTKVLASTGGFTSFGAGVKVSLNATI